MPQYMIRTRDRCRRSRPWPDQGLEASGCLLGPLLPSPRSGPRSVTVLHEDLEGLTERQDKRRGPHLWGTLSSEPAGPKRASVGPLERRKRGHVKMEDGQSSACLSTA